MTGRADPSADTVADLVRTHDFDRYAASLFAPADARPHLLALYAFDVELARIRDVVSDPLPGELRLQWWRDALETPDRADAVSHPVARALEGAVAYGRLPRQALLDLVDARVDDLYDDPPPTTLDLEAQLGATHSAILRLASLVAAAGKDPGGAGAAGAGGVAQGLARLLRQLPREAARGQLRLPVDRMAALGVSREDVVAGRGGEALGALVGELVGLAHLRLGEAREDFATTAPAAAAAFLPLAFVGRDLDRLEKGRPLVPSREPPRWRRLARLWSAARRTPPF